MTQYRLFGEPEFKQVKIITKEEENKLEEITKKAVEDNSACLGILKKTTYFEQETLLNLIKKTPKKGKYLITLKENLNTAPQIIGYAVIWDGFIPFKEDYVRGEVYVAIVDPCYQGDLKIIKRKFKNEIKKYKKIKKENKKKTKSF